MSIWSSVAWLAGRSSKIAEKRVSASAAVAVTRRG
jgi:hypothetical protein